MKTNAEARNIESTFKKQTKKFTIEASAKAFQVLSSNLYTDKPLAIVRELSANALDSHRQIKETKPFSITLPSRMNPSFEIRDYGIGMSPQKIETLYRTFFGSDKCQSDDAIGGFGLGSKTPFSYTDTFTLISYWGNKKYTWLCFINEEGEPALQPVSQEDSKELRGIHYIIPVKETDFSTFKYKAQNVLQYFPKDTYSINTEINDVQYSLKNDLYGIRIEKSYINKETRVIMGNMHYKLSLDALHEKVKNKYRTLIRNGNIDFFCNIGDIDIQVSREALSYDKKSQIKIETMLETVYNTMKKDIQLKIDSCSSYLNACITGKEFYNNSIFRDSDFEWRGKKLKLQLNIGNYEEAALISSDSITANNNLRIPFGQYRNFDPAQVKDLNILLYETETSFNNLRIKHLLETSNKQFLVFKSEQKMLEWMWDAQIFHNICSGDLPLPEKEAKTLVARTSKPVKIKLLSGYSWNEISESIEDINKRENTCWAPLHGNGDNPWAENKCKILYRILQSFKPIEVIGVPRSLKHKEKHITLPHIEEYARVMLIDLIDTEERYRAAFTNRSKLEWLSSFSMHAEKKWNHLEIYKYAKLHEETAEFTKIADSIAQTLEWDTVNSLINDDHKYKEKYRLFSILDNYSFYGVDFRTTDYINDVLGFIHGES